MSSSITPVQDLYYFRQLEFNTFGIHIIKPGKMTCYVYHEGKRGKGANEVFSNLSHYITRRIPPDIRKLVIFGNNCARQNEIQTLIRLMMALVERQRFESVQII